MTTQAWMLRALLLVGLVIMFTGCVGTEDGGTVEVGTPVSGATIIEIEPPSSTTTTSTTLPPDDPHSGAFFFQINGGDVYSHLSQLELSFFAEDYAFNKMKISSNLDCQGGTFESFVETKRWTNFSHNQKVDLSVVFMDGDKRLSPCFARSIIHDDQGPQILFTKYPMAQLEEGVPTEVEFQVSDISPLMQVSCRLNQTVVPCLVGANTAKISNMGPGQYQFYVEAQDIHGFSSSQSIQWTVVSIGRTLTQTVFVKEDKKVDVLLVIDNSGSMQYEQKNMAQRVQNMLAILRGFDYRIGITTTDPNPTKVRNGITYYGDGDLIPIVGSQGQQYGFWVESHVPEAEAQAALGKTLQRAETGSGSEQGIRSTYRFVQKYNLPAEPAKNFFRAGANFATLVISDEDESANTDANDPEKLLALISTSFQNQKAYSFHSIITKPGDTGCRSTYGATYGERYHKISTLTGGVIGSVCEADYAAQVSGIAESIRDLVKQFSLTCQPVAGKPITIQKDGVSFVAPYVLEGMNLKFNDALEAGEYKITYVCL